MIFVSGTHLSQKLMTISGLVVTLCKHSRIFLMNLELNTIYIFHLTHMLKQLLELF
jgi:hypothetical protein